MTPDEQDADRRFWEPTEWLEHLRFRIVDEGLGQDEEDEKAHGIQLENER